MSLESKEQPSFCQQIDNFMMNCSLDELHHINRELVVELEFRRFSQSRIDKLKQELREIKAADEVESEEESEEEKPKKQVTKRPVAKKPIRK